jgi:NitT/TauT family transport system substrate-binding protein
MRNRTLGDIALRVIAVTLTLAATLTGLAESALALEKLKFGTGSAISLTSAPLTMAISMGYFKEEGLDVEVIPFRGGSGVLIPQIVNKSIEVGFPTLDVLMIARQPGRDYMPLKFFYNVTRTSIYEIVVLESSSVKTLADLKGKKIGVGALSWGNIPITKAMLKDAGLDVDKDVELIAVGQGPAAYQALTSGRIDALNLFDVPHAELESLGTKIRRLPVKDRFVQLGSNSLIAHEDTIKSQPQMLARVGRAIAKGTVACNANVPACVKAFWELYPTLKPTQGTEEEKVAKAARVLTTRVEKMLAFPAGGARNLGEFPPQMWKDYIEVLHSAGQLSTTAIPVESLYTNEFIAQFNNFDVDAVVRAARALK